MEDKNLNQHNISVGNNSVLFGTSSDDIEQGLHNGQFIDTSDTPIVDDKNKIVNEQDQNEVVNSSPGNSDEKILSQPAVADNTFVKQQAVKPNELEQNVPELDPDKDTIDNAGQISKAED
jgi:hypothetical protein